jgi:hypothetical protein
MKNANSENFKKLVNKLSKVNNQRNEAEADSGVVIP